MMFFTLRSGCQRTIEYIAQNGRDYRLPETSYLANWATSYLQWVNHRETYLNGRKGNFDSVTTQTKPVTWELPKLKPQFVFYKPLDSEKRTFEVIDLREIFTVDEADRKKLEALSRQSIWYSRRAAA